MANNPDDESTLTLSQEEQRRSRICLICGGPAETYHLNYGASTCLSCRAFFRRTVQNDRMDKLVCKGSGMQGVCVITLKTRKRCQKCRFAKCLKVGMQPECVLNEEGKRLRFRKMIKKQMKGCGSKWGGEVDLSPRGRRRNVSTGPSEVSQVRQEGQVTGHYAVNGQQLAKNNDVNYMDSFVVVNDSNVQRGQENGVKEDEIVVLDLRKENRDYPQATSHLPLHHSRGHYHYHHYQMDHVNRQNDEHYLNESASIPYKRPRIEPPVDWYGYITSMAREVRSKNHNQQGQVGFQIESSNAVERNFVNRVDYNYETVSEYIDFIKLEK